MQTVEETSAFADIMKNEGAGVSADDLRHALSQVAVSDETAALFERGSNGPIASLEEPKTHAAWKFYGDLCRAYWRSRNKDWTGNASFSREHFLEGNFAEDLVAKFVAEAGRSPVVPFQTRSSAPGYYFNAGMDPLVETYNKIFVFRTLSPAAMDALHGCLDQIRPLVTNCLGTSWRVVQARYWEVRPGGEGVGTNSWHTDGFPLDALKILSFFSEVDETKGSTQFKQVDGTVRTFRGPAGKWILFRNSVVQHCGLPPIGGSSNRLTVEITLAPSLVTDARPVFAGVNGHYPYVPWQGLRSSAHGATIPKKPAPESTRGRYRFWEKLMGR
jgi:hypothetical protein